MSLMTVMLLPMLAILGQSAPAADAADATDKCLDPKPHFAISMRPSRPARPLNQEELAKQQKAVMYSEGGCVKPILVRENVGTIQR